MFDVGVSLKKGPERKDIIDAVSALKKTKNPLSKKIARLLESPRRKRIEVNISKIAKYSIPSAKQAKQDLIVVVPGKVLGDGTIDRGVNVVALSFSATAEKKIKDSGGKTYNFEWLINQITTKKEGKRDIIILR